MKTNGICLTSMHILPYYGTGKAEHEAVSRSLKLSNTFAVALSMASLSEADWLSSLSFPCTPFPSFLLALLKMSYILLLSREIIFILFNFQFSAHKSNFKRYPLKLKKYIKGILNICNPQKAFYLHLSKYRWLKILKSILIPRWDLQVWIWSGIFTLKTLFLEDDALGTFLYLLKTFLLTRWVSLSLGTTCHDMQGIQTPVIVLHH